MKKDTIASIQNLALCLQTMIKTRFGKKIKPIYTKGKYKSVYLSFYRNHVYQFYAEDHGGYILVYLLRDDKVIKKDIIQKNDSIEQFYRKITPFFAFIS